MTLLDPRAGLAAADKELDALGAAWLDARVRGDDTTQIVAAVEVATRRYRKYERKIRKGRA